MYINVVTSCRPTPFQDDLKYRKKSGLDFMIIVTTSVQLFTTFLQPTTQIYVGTMVVSNFGSRNTIRYVDSILYPTLIAILVICILYFLVQHYIFTMGLKSKIGCDILKTQSFKLSWINKAIFNVFSFHILLTSKELH